jgi:hypothetical protein
MLRKRGNKMDLLTAALGQYLNLTSNYFFNNFKEIKNLEAKTVSLDYEGYKLHYRYKNWKINDDSVCSRYQTRKYSVYSNCTVKAKKAFNEICEELIFKPTTNPFNSSFTTMYCNAADNYEPVIARASLSKPLSSLKSAQRDCSNRILEEKQYPSPISAKERISACEKYQLLKEN